MKVFNTQDPLIDLNFVTTPISMFEDRKEIGNASGFFFKYGDKRYLVTNRHVVIDEVEKFFPNKLVISLHKRTDNLKDVERVEILLYRNEKKLWIEHLDYHNNLCDVVLIELPEKLVTAY